MKIIIIGAPRSGTTSLMKGIGEQGFKKYQEPWNEVKKNHPNYKLIPEGKVVYKTISRQVPKYLDLSPTDFYLELVKSFDRIILLNRLNIEEHLISIKNLSYRSSIKKKLQVKWSEKEIPSSFKWSRKETLESIRLHTEVLNTVSTQTGIPVTYYEDLYSVDREVARKEIEKLDLDLDIGILLKRLDPKYKYKQKQTIL
jgi:predicted transposase YbfD/YdcC